MNKMIGILVAVVMVMSGCASQLAMKKATEVVPGVGVVTALSIESNNGVAGNLKVIQTYADGKKTGEYSYGNEGLVYPVVSGGMQAAGMMGGAALLRPDRSETNVKGVSSADADATAVATQAQIQGQIQGQTQNQSNTNKPVFNNADYNSNSNWNSNANNKPPHRDHGNHNGRDK